MVKGILVFWKASLFAGRRRNEGLGRSVACSGYPPEARGAPVTADVRRAPRRGTSSRMRHKAYAPDAGTRDRCLRLGDASFTRSFDPCTSILTMHRGESLGGGALALASRLGKLTQVGGTNTGVSMNGRSAARRVSLLSQGKGVAR
jgi:hypothetical protein